MKVNATLLFYITCFFFYCCFERTCIPIEVKLSHYHHAGDKGERKYSYYTFFTSALDGGEWAASAPATLYTRYPLNGRLGGPQSWSGHRGNRKNPLPLPGIEPRSSSHPVCSQTLQLTAITNLNQPATYVVIGSCPVFQCPMLSSELR
jgi:hypothetical protein